jgi:biopolymer transport protein TolQ
MQNTIFHMVIQAGYVVKFVLLVLLFFSVVSWAIILFKYRYLTGAAKQNSAFVLAFRSSRDPRNVLAMAGKYPLSPISNVYRAVYSEGIEEAGEMRRALKRYEALETAKMESYLGFLATTGSATPFIGLFGTVWGIMNSFRGIGATGAASLAVVAPGIAEALIATAMGLVAAIPAVVAYNYYLGRARRMIIEMEDFSEDIRAFLLRRPDEG